MQDLGARLTKCFISLSLVKVIGRSGKKNERKIKFRIVVGLDYIFFTAEILHGGVMNTTLVLPLLL